MNLKFEYAVLPNQTTEALYAFIPRAACPIGHIFYRNSTLNHQLSTINS